MYAAGSTQSRSNEDAARWRQVAGDTIPARRLSTSRRVRWRYAWSKPYQFSPKGRISTLKDQALLG